MPKPQDVPQLVTKTEAEIAEVKALIQASSLSESVKHFVLGCIDSALWLPRQLEQRKISLSRFKQMLFGKKRCRKAQEGQGVAEQPATPEAQIPLAEEATSARVGDKNLAVTKANKPVGHGRMAHTVYDTFETVQLPLEFKAGAPCPLHCHGKLYDHPPGLLVRVYGQNFAQVYKYTVEKRRCSACGGVVSAKVPAELGTEKYHLSFKALLALQKYYVAVPFYRQEYFQRLVGFPLPDATQWQLMEEVASCGYPILTVLKHLAAQAQVIHNDDTRVKIVEVMAQNQLLPKPARTGMHTTGFIAEYEGHQIALFVNGTQHAGENLTDLLALRDPKRPPIIQMCDALAQNIPQGLATIVCNCLSHAFRKFEELSDFFPAECLSVMKQLAYVYSEEEKTTAMSAQARLIHHQSHSAPIMAALHSQVRQWLAARQVEPNSELGKALRYLLKHWLKLTRFLTVAGAPLDNNCVERALKIAIRHRKSSLVYRTRYSASLGGLLTSLIYTCHLAGENAYRYLCALQQYRHEVLTHPRQWLPWNYNQSIGKRPVAMSVPRLGLGGAPPNLAAL